MTKKVKIDSQGIESKIPDYDTAHVLIEYINNAIDAGAKEVRINYISDGMSLEESMQYIDSITISDNGHGIKYNSLETSFTKVFISNKKSNTNICNGNHFFFGSEGKGRFAFTRIGNSAIWNTTYNNRSKSYSYSISINSTNLEEYSLTDKKAVSLNTGTVVKINDITKPILLSDMKNSITATIRQYFAWYLELKTPNNFKLYLNDNEITPQYLIKSINQHTKEISGFKFEFKFIVWNTNLKHQSSKVYCVDQNGNWVTTKTTKLNNKSDEFHHSVFVYSNFYDQSLDFKDNGLLDSELLREKIQSEIDSYISAVLHQIKRKEIEEMADKLIEDFEANKFFPEYNKSHILQLQQHNLLVQVIKDIYLAMPEFYTKFTVPHKKIFIRLVNRIIEQDDLDNLFSIINNVLELNPVELSDFVQVLNKHKLNHIINTVKILDNRLQMINDFDRLIRSSEGKDTYESAVQNFMESNYWLIGEDFELCAAEDDDFKTAIKKFAHLFREKDDEKILEDASKYIHSDMNREMDILIGRQDIRHGCFNGTVLELKRPRVTIGKPQHRQLEDYKDALLDFQQFNDPKYQWNFFIIGLKIDKEYFDAEYKKSAKSNKLEGLIEEGDNYRIYVKTWAQLFNDFKMKYEYLTKKLHHQASIISDQM